MERGVWGTQIINVDSYGFQVFGGRKKSKTCCPCTWTDYDLDPNHCYTQSCLLCCVDGARHKYAQCRQGRGKLNSSLHTGSQRPGGFLDLASAYLF